MRLLQSWSVQLACRYLLFSPFFRLRNEGPKLYGTDVFVPVKIIESIPDFDAQSPIYAACQDNGWLDVSSGALEKMKSRFRMEPSGDRSYYIAFNMKGKKFYPVQLGPNNEMKWGKWKVSVN